MSRVVLLTAWLCLSAPAATAMSCYQCLGGSGDKLCTRYTGASCPFGLFGCVKMTTYSGGVDKLGNFIDDDRSVIAMARACNILPIGGVDACQQQVLPGLRIVTCYCYSDYCNDTTRHSVSFIALSTLLLVRLF